MDREKEISASQPLTTLDVPSLDVTMETLYQP
jgi:hypothetical protein